MKINGKIILLIVIFICLFLTTLCILKVSYSENQEIYFLSPKANSEFLHVNETKYLKDIERFLEFTFSTRSFFYLEHLDKDWARRVYSYKGDLKEREIDNTTLIILNNTECEVIWRYNLPSNIESGVVLINASPSVKDVAFFAVSTDLVTWTTCKYSGDSRGIKSNIFFLDLSNCKGKKELYLKFFGANKLSVTLDYFLIIAKLSEDNYVKPEHEIYITVDTWGVINKFIYENKES